MADTLSKLFGSTARVKLLRLFIYNPTVAFTTKEVASRSRVKRVLAARQISSLLRLGFLSKNARGRSAHYALNSEFPYLSALQELLVNSSAQATTMYERIKSFGIIKLVVVAGIFVGEWEGSIDLLIVADKIQEDKIEKFVKVLESEMGREIRYALLNTQEFFYRLSINDHLLRDVLDYRHQVVFDRLEIGLT